MRKFLLLLLFAVGSANPSHPLHIKQMEFKNQPIADILFVLAEVSGTSIIIDETVSGNASYFFSETDFETALRAFLATYKLFYTKESSIYYVSRIYVSHDRAADTVTLKADDTDIRLLVRALARSSGKTILFDVLPNASLSVQTEGMDMHKALQMLMKQFPSYTVEKDEGYYYIRKLALGSAQTTVQKRISSIFVGDDSFSLSAERIQLSDLLSELFEKADLEYSLLLRGDTILEKLSYSRKKFDELLRLVLDQAGADYMRIGTVYYIFEIQKKDILKKLKLSISVPLIHIPVQDFLSLLPQDAASNLVKTDKGTNTVYLSGSVEELKPVQEFIALVDRPMEGKSYCRFQAKFLKVKDIIPLLPQRLLTAQPIVLHESNSFVLPVSEEGKGLLLDYLSLIDRKTEAFPFRLKYIKTEELLKYLPPSASRDEILETGTSSAFFLGSEEKRRRFLKDLEEIDVPKPQIRYELLVIQFQEGDNLAWARSYEHRHAQGYGGTSIIGNLASLLSIDFDIISVFGYQFAAKLSLELGTNRAYVFADTTLNGLSGQDVKFQNTNTFRYRDTTIDPDTMKPVYTGVTREITSGLIIGINGWVSGDGMITMSVSATVSKRGADVSSVTGNPPPTSEKAVTTQLRTLSGKPVIISGLLQRDETESVQKLPLFADIPLVGYLFKDRNVSRENTEMVIYIIPHLEQTYKPLDRMGKKIESVYLRFVEWRKK